MRAVLWYSGEATVLPHAKFNNRSSENLKIGNDERVGLWGANSRKTFISRAAYMFDNSPVDCYNMILTYRKDPDHKLSKKHINAFLQWLRRRNMYGYFYAVEYQERKKSGLKPALHYHLVIACDLLDQLGRGYKQEVNSAWCRLRDEEPSANAVRDISKVRIKRSLIGYVSKLSMYCSKTAALRNQHKIPDDVRLWATSYNLVGKEKIKIQDENNVNRLLLKAYRIAEQRKNGFEFTCCDLSREDTREFYEMDKAIQDRCKARQRKNQEKANRKKENVRKRLQMRLY